MSAFLDDKGLNKFFQAIKAKFDTRYLNGPANSLIELNKKSFLKVWCGTADEFKQVEAKENDIAYLVEGESADTEYAPITHAARHNKDGADPITPTAIGAVGYDAAQSLTDTQKTQARGNINAAPDGFGLGGTAKMLTEADNVDNIKVSGWYTWDWDPSKQPAGLPEEAKYHTGNMRVDGTTGGFYTTQTIYLAKNGSSVNAGDECVIQRLHTTAPWEWVNPPMKLGVEYRTTERYLGKPVYVKLIDCGAMPNSTDKTINGGISNGESLVGICGEYYNSTTSVSLPYTSGGSTIAKCSAYISSGHCIIVLWAKNNESAQNARVLIKYTKTTD